MLVLLQLIKLLDENGRKELENYLADPYMDWTVEDAVNNLEEYLYEVHSLDVEK